MSQGIVNNPSPASFGTTCASLAKGVTGGDAHNHTGGGGQLLPVVGGGTGVTTAADARTSLGVLKGSHTIVSDSISWTFLSGNWYNWATVSPGYLSTGLYLADFYWDHGGSGSPYLVRSIFFVPIILIAAGASAGGSFPSWGYATHTYLGTTFLLRGRGGGSMLSCGLQFAVNVSLPSGTLYRNLYRIGP